MTRTQILQRLQTIKDKGTQALKLLESKPFSVDTQAEIRSLTQWIKEELHNEYNRMNWHRSCHFILGCELDPSWDRHERRFAQRFWQRRGLPSLHRWHHLGAACGID